MRVTLRGVLGPRTCSWRLEGALRRPGPGCAPINRQQAAPARARPASPGGPGQLRGESPPRTEKAEPKEGRPPRSWAARGGGTHARELPAKERTDRRSTGRPDSPAAEAAARPPAVDASTPLPKGTLAVATVPPGSGASQPVHEAAARVSTRHVSAAGSEGLAPAGLLTPMPVSTETALSQPVLVCWQPWRRLSILLTPESSTGLQGG